jgi:hypothetical protein
MNVAYIETNGIRIRKKKRERLRDVVSLVTVLALVVSLIFNFYIDWKNKNIHASLYNLKTPFITINLSGSVRVAPV